MTVKGSRRAVAALAYVAGVLLFAEASARLAFSLGPFFARVQGQDEASWRLRFVRRQARGGGLYYGFDVPHPRRGWALRPGVRDLEVFDGRRLNSNSEGVRGRREYARAKPPGVQRVLVLGDSFTFGDEVSDDETYAHVLGELLPGVEVINLGVHGYGQDQMLLYLQEVGARYQPDVVLLGFVSDDMERNLLAFRDFAKPRFTLREGRLELGGTPVPTPEQVLAREWRRSRLIDLFTLLRARWDARTGEDVRRGRELGVAILDEIARTARSLRATPAFAYLPVYGEIDKPDGSMTQRERFFFGYCRERGIQSMYLRRFFLRKLRAGVSFKTYGHWDALEHRTVAEGIRAYLVEKELVRVRE